MQTLKMAHDELFRRSPDERFESLDALETFCRSQQDQSEQRWLPPTELFTVPAAGRLVLAQSDPVDGPRMEMNDWSFSQLCRLAGVSKDTVNRLTPDTAGRVFGDTLPRQSKPWQLLVGQPTQDGAARLRSIHTASYTRLYHAELLEVVRRTATDFQPAQKSAGGGTGLYCSEQDMFSFLIDPTGWIDIEGEAFAPGFFVWNSEVGRRSIGIQTFWFQAVCANHLVWDAVEVIDFSRKHTANVREALGEIERMIESLTRRRDERRDRFASVITKAMKTSLGDDAQQAAKTLSQHGISGRLAKRALAIAEQKGRLTIFSVVDALTQLAGQVQYAGDRTLADSKAAGLLALAL